MIENNMKVILTVIAVSTNFIASKDGGLVPSVGAHSGQNCEIVSGRGYGEIEDLV